MPQQLTHKSCFDRAAFTILEIAVVVTVIGILAALAVPYYKRSKDSAIIGTLVNDLRVFSQEFTNFELNFSTYPPTQTTAGLYPIGMEDRLSHTWKLPSVIGGTYSWVYSGSDDADNRYAYIEIVGTSDSLRIDLARLSKIDDDIDDGNLSTGKLRKDGPNIRYYIEQ